MLIKEYRIPLPLTVEEYRIAQLYMIAKKSREESSGAGSGVEIIVNEPYQDGPGGNGQYTRKIYHVGSHLPGWIKGLLPKSALTVEEEAWNAYPYTKTRYTCPFVEKFSLEIETYYFPDKGHQDNVFKLSGADLRNRIVDLIDIVKDQLYGADYTREEDPTVYCSERTGRGPLSDCWLDEHWEEVQGKQQPTARNMSLMCAYKLCRVEFRYWGMQTKLEKFIHDTALRKTMLRAHRQAWAWQDEWYGLSMDDIREIERQTQLALQRKMGNEEGGDEQDGDGEEGEGAKATAEQDNRSANQMYSIEKTNENSTPHMEKKEVIPIITTTAEADHGGPGAGRPYRKEKPKPSAPSSEEEDTPDGKQQQRRREEDDEDEDEDEDDEDEEEDERHGGSRGQSQQGAACYLRKQNNTGSKSKLHSPLGSAHSFDLQVANWRMEKLEVDSKSGSEEEFFDCLARGDMGEKASLVKWSSLELLAEEDDSPQLAPNHRNQEDSIFSQSYLQRVTSERGTRRSFLGHHSSSIDRGTGHGDPSPPGSPGLPSCPTTVLVLIMHAGSVLDASSDMTTKKSDITTFRGALESVMRQHYPSLVGHVALRLVACPAVCSDALGILSSLSPYSFNTSPSSADVSSLADVPIGAIPLLATCSPDFQESVSRAVSCANQTFADFLKSDEGRGFNGQVVLIGDSMGSVLAHDALCRSAAHQGSEASGLNHIADFAEANDLDATKLLTAPSPRRRSSSTSESRVPKFEFEVGDFFMFGSPLAVILSARRLSDARYGASKPACTQLYNLFHPTDPTAARLEPLLSARFSMLPPLNVPRYAKYPLGNGQPCHLLELIQSSPQLFADGGPAVPSARRLSDTSIQSAASGMIDNVPLTTINQLQQRWWGSKRLDYALYCPEGLSNFPSHALPHLFHASYWESSDVVAFILQQIGRFDEPGAAGYGYEKDVSSFRPSQPREKWNKKRTSVKLKNVAANHRANDVIVREGEPQRLVARFMYGPLDVITLAGERVDIHVMRDPPAGEWQLLSTETTDKNGRVSYIVPAEQACGYGIFPVKMVVRGDHTSVDFYIAVVPPRTECIVFSIDGSFTASVSVTGKDPKVRAGAVDVCRHWQELGYLLVYITGRPDMQQQRVLSWLSQHNFPHGLVSFADGLSTDPLGHKATYLNNLILNQGLIVHAAYGSSKDISVYTSIGLKPKQIFITGKVSKKHQSMATPLTDGYAAHLSSLMTVGGSRPAQGNARMVIPRSCFNLPGQNQSIRRRRFVPG
ncbi:protein retinal degeneration B isoform X1 [Anopheles merus]|uniref:protein retinal degeneration B isoform X1 n=1 Tax=Anopheles merus TaxID=30066 RepID=UPI001BE489C8|nr:protein retinal degeneration B isoform X1 [Anopheles merus]XP_041763791.1 protein retinal degeneration B isoform X1 [Anopheles merus]XP_041763800.1 protein retinal degeneration B isoform X1 [Anopheles merus]XP_041763806.1 protein retinal degeneration B isoform X1 [Anopheles merus]XP_041763816.1 protein retinal degeneration B isoform X1 [Anopheles merus]XP_041763824.1 protein retinal degeneration B isoform X1 [Anopheles merus]XP_041763833.1 protein retinal degeneration B isoform X1 [Anophel